MNANKALWDIACERSLWVFRHSGPPVELLDIFRHYYGPTMNAFEAAAKDGREEQLQAERTEIPATYLKVAVTKG